MSKVFIPKFWFKIKNNLYLLLFHTRKLIYGKTDRFFSSRFIFKKQLVSSMLDGLPWGQMAHRPDLYYTEGDRLHRALRIGTKYSEGSGKIVCGAFNASNDKFTYGRISIKADMVKTEHVNPALWLMGHGGGEYFEIDLFELFGGSMQTTVHFSVNKTRYQLPFKPRIDYSGYHDYDVEWTDKEIKFFFDGIPYYKVNFKKALKCAKESYVILSVAAHDNYPKDKEFVSTIRSVKYYELQP